MAKGDTAIAVLIPGQGFGQVILSPKEYARFKRMSKAKQREYLDREIATFVLKTRQSKRPT